MKIKITKSNYQWEVRNADEYFIEGYDTYEKASNVMKQLETYTIDYSERGEYSVYSDDGNFIDTFETQRQTYKFLLDLIGVLNILI